jgi:hypothetical protein
MGGATGRAERGVPPGIQGRRGDRGTSQGGVGALSDRGHVQPDIDDLAADWRRTHTVPAVSATQGEVLPPASGAIDRDVLRDLAAWSERHEAVLREFGRDLLAFLSERQDASRPVSISQLAKRLADERAGPVRNLTQRELTALIADAHNRGFTPGLVRTPAGYAIAESHFSFKRTQHHDAKSAIAHAAADMVASGQSVGLDGGTTTLPIAEALVARLESDQLADVTVLTNSLPVVQCFARFVEERGWSDSEATAASSSAPACSARTLRRWRKSSSPAMIVFVRSGRW